MEANSLKTAALLTTNRVLNEVIIPSAVKSYHYSYSIKDKFTSSSNDVKLLTDPLRTDETKSFTVHNIPAGSDAGLLMKSTPIKDQSAFQQFTDTLFSLAELVAKSATALSPYNIFTGFIKTDRQTIDPAGDIAAMATGSRNFLESSQVGDLPEERFENNNWGRTPVTIKSYLIERLKKDKKGISFYDEDVFNQFVLTANLSMEGLSAEMLNTSLSTNQLYVKQYH